VTAGARAAGAKVILPGPYTFCGALDNRSGETFEGLTHRLGRLLAEEVRELRTLGYETFQFQEPLLVVEPPEGPRGEAVLAAYRSIASAVENATSIVWTYFADAAPVLPWLVRLPVGVIGVDLAETEVGELKGSLDRRGLGVGCVDPRTTLVEDPSEVARVVRSLTERLRPPVLWLGPGGPLDLLPSSAATRKLHLLPAAKQALTAQEAS
jgi:methionine synthase II (cobalamin-independent)